MRPTVIALVLVAVGTGVATEARAAGPRPKVYSPNPVPGDIIKSTPLSGAPPFLHWDCREFPDTCKVPWVLGPAPVPDLDGNGTADTAADRAAAVTAFTNAFGAWGAVTPAVIDFRQATAAAPATSGLALDGHNTLNFKDAARDDVDDVQVVAVGNAVAAGGIVVSPGVNGTLEVTPQGDDMVMGTSIVDGGNLVANTPAPIMSPPGVGGPCVVPGTNGVLETQPKGDDLVMGPNIVDGGNNSCETGANNQGAVNTSLGLTGFFFNNKSGVILESDIVFTPTAGWRTVGDGVVLMDDVQFVPLGASVAAGGVVVAPGPNGVLETQPQGDDVVMGANIVDGGNLTADTTANNRDLVDLEGLAMHEIGHFMGIAHPLEKADLDDLQVRGADDVQNIAVGAAAAAGARTVSAGNDGALKSSAGAGEFSATTSIFRGGAGNVTSQANDVTAAGTVVDPGPDGVLVTWPQGDDVVMGTNIIDGGNKIAETTANNAATQNPFPNAIMNPAYNPLAATNHRLAQSDTDSCNFLYTPDLGDAPDPFIPLVNKYPTLVHSPITFGRTLNGIMLDKVAEGADHLFGFFGSGAAPRYQYEWLGTTAGKIDDSPLECEARVPDKDDFDDGVTFAGPFKPGGPATKVTVHVRTAADVEGVSHTYDNANPMFINGWFDWNADGDWDDPGEHVIGTPANDFKVTAGGASSHVFDVVAPAGAKAGGYARFRLDYREDVGQVSAIDSTPDRQVLNLSRGAAQFGEVEDYPIKYCMLDCKTKGRLGNGAQVDCNLIANDAGGSFQLGKNAFMNDGTFISADAVKLGQDTSVWSALYNTLTTGDGAAIRDGTSTPTLPFLDPVPTASPFPCSGSTVTVQGLQTIALPPGTYNRVRVLRGGTLTLDPGGLYNFCSMQTTREAAIFITGSDQTTINVAETLRIGNASVLQPGGGAPPPNINVAGTLVRVGRGAQLDAFVTAPNASFRVGRGGHINGTFIMGECGSDKEVVCGCDIASP